MTTAITPRAIVKKAEEALRFIDLFAGLGGFHLALTELGHKCVYACEVNEKLAALYEKNFGIRPHADIRTLDIPALPPHDILCAGFPCQPFSKAGEQQGLQCPQWGDLIDYVIRILRTHTPRYFIIENVPNLVRHNNGKTWKSIEHRLRLAGYSVKDQLISPHHVGVPQVRERAFIVGRREGLGKFSVTKTVLEKKSSIHSVLDKRPKDARKLPAHFIEYLNAWQVFLDKFPADEQLPSFPIWAMEFGATYPYEKKSPAHAKNIRAFKGSFGRSLRGLSKQEVVAALPAYARGRKKVFPDWKIEFIRQNRELYQRHKKWIDKWLPAIQEFAPSFQKFEWNCKGEKRDIWQYVIQFRASGRKRRNFRSKRRRRPRLRLRQKPPANRLNSPRTRFRRKGRPRGRLRGKRSARPSSPAIRKRPAGWLRSRRLNSVSSGRPLRSIPARSSNVLRPPTRRKPKLNADGFNRNRRPLASPACSIPSATSFLRPEWPSEKPGCSANNRNSRSVRSRSGTTTRQRCSRRRHWRSRTSANVRRSNSATMPPRATRNSNAICASRKPHARFS